MIRLKELREERGWNMRDAARFLNQKYTTYVNHEKEYREPNSEDLIAYARAYNVTVDFLVGRTNEKTATFSDGHLGEFEKAVSNASERERKLIMRVLSMPAEQQDAFLSLTESPRNNQSILDERELH